MLLINLTSIDGVFVDVFHKKKTALIPRSRQVQLSVGSAIVTHKLTPPYIVMLLITPKLCTLISLRCILTGGITRSGGPHG